MDNTRVTILNIYIAHWVMSRELTSVQGTAFERFCSLNNIIDNYELVLDLWKKKDYAAAISMGGL